MESRAGSFSAVANLHWNMRDRLKQTYDKAISVEPDGSPTMMLQCRVCKRPGVNAGVSRGGWVPGIDSEQT